MLVLECLAVLYALYINYALKPVYFIIHLIIFMAMVIVTRILTVAEPEECSDFKQGAITHVCVYVLFDREQVGSSATGMYVFRHGGMHDL